MRYNQNWDDLGRSIQDAVDWAVNSQDYHKLNQTIRQVVESAVGAGGEVLRRAAETAQGQNQNAMSQRQLYGTTGGMTVRGIVKAVMGLGIAGLSAMGMFAALLMGMWHPDFGMTIGMLGLGVAGGGVLTFSGVRNLGMVKRFRTYRRLLGNKTQCALDKLARAVGKSVDYVRGDLNRMFGKGFFLEGHMDNEQTMLITSDETYRNFEQARLHLEQQKKQEAAHKASQPDPRIREVLEKGNAFIAEIRRCNDAIPGEEISAKISRMERIVRRIFDRVREHPELVPDLKKMMDYYLPMTVKLLNAYADMDAQPVQGENIQNSKREIEATLDTLNQAFEKLMDDLFEDTVLDVSSDITVLKTMLAQEGLTEDELTKMRKTQNL